MSPPILATGFVSDSAEEGTTFPSAGGNSGDPRVQAIYWRCIAVLFASARITSPQTRLMLFANVPPPVVDGIDLAGVLARLGVEQRRVPLTRRLVSGKGQSWGNVLYFLDAFDALADEPDETPVALVDSDVLCAWPLDPLFGLLDRADFAAYRVETRMDEDVNGMTVPDMTHAARTVDHVGSDADIAHYGGELLAARLGTWRHERGRFLDLYDRARAGDHAFASIRTEEHLYSIALADPALRVAEANPLMKRIWTSPRCNTARPGDENLLLWHLPAEKRYGFADLFSRLAERDFDTAVAPDAFRALAGRLCAVPAKTPGKIVHDGVRQIAAKMGLRR